MASYQHAHAAYYSPNRASQARDQKSADESLLWKLLLLTALTYFVWNDKISITFAPLGETQTAAVSTHRTGASLFGLPVARVTAAKTPGNAMTQVAGPLANATLAIDPNYALRNGLAIAEVRTRLAICNDYVERFAPVAVAEMHRSGIPASIILAQGLLESDAGESTLAQKTNNHFGIKCFSKHCSKGHCVNFGDDSHKDFFIKYGNAWGSFRAHSQFLKNTKRYAPLFQLDRSDYSGWANGLAERGYATDKKYGAKLIAIIEHMRLERYDR